MKAELTPRALATGALIGALLAAGNVYLGNKLGIIENGGVTASLLALGLLLAAGRLGRPATALEANTSLTVVGGAASMCIAGGLVGPVAALALGGTVRPLGWVGAWGAAVALLGTLLVLPLRRLYLVTRPLPFPSATAAAELVRSFASDRALRRRQVRLVLALALTCAFVLLRDAAGVLPAALPVLGVTLSLSPLAVAAGVICGPRMTLSLLLGAAVARLLGARGASADLLVWPGVTLMVVSTLTDLARDGATIRTALADLRGVRASRGLPLALAVAGVAVVVTTGLALGAGVGPSLVGLGAALAFVVASARAMGETDQPPVGAAGAAGQVAGAAVASGTAGSLGAGGIASGAAMYGSALMASWKTGALLGASPRAQLLAHLLGIAIGAFASTAAFALLLASGTLGTAAFPAPAAQSWRATAEALRGAAGLPPDAIVPCAVAAVVAVLVTLLSRGRAGRLLPSPVAAGMGFLLPFDFSVLMAAGGLLTWVSGRRDPARIEELLVPLASGVIVGEVVLGLGLPLLGLL